MNSSTIIKDVNSMYGVWKRCFQGKILGFYRGLFSRGKTHGFLRKYFSGKLCGFLKNHFQEMRKFHKLWKIFLRVKTQVKI